MPLINTFPFPEPNPFILKKEELNSKAAVLKKRSFEACKRPEILSAALASLLNSSSVMVIMLKSCYSTMSSNKKIVPKSIVVLESSTGKF